VRPFAAILAALAVPLLAIVAVQQDQRRTEHELARVASDIAGRKSMSTAPASSSASST
jgi:hypothetical protein